MPFPVIAAIAAGSALGGGVIDAAAQAAQNRKQRKFSREMYGRQRTDALDDWYRETTYNSPQMQMQRFRDAGLNPNLIYGQTNEAPSVRSSSAPAWNPTAPKYGKGIADAGQSLSAIYDIKLKEAQTNNVMANTTVAMEEKVLKQAQTYAAVAGVGKTDAETQSILQGLYRANELRDVHIDAQRLLNDRTVAETGVLLSRNEREAIAQVSSLKEAAMRILHMREQNAKSQAERDQIKATIAHINSSTTINELDADLKRKGIQPHDALWQRKLSEVIQTNAGKVLPSLKKAVYSLTPGRFFGNGKKK